ncbi:MAG: 2-oxoacid:acceptor oxidoreductase subunit alpha [Deltaproteobacteria bacterium]|nr:2-oxoacid:acceptor oxidoreductase subunit alpha [Deltaproteobacteria bacterium]
MSNSLVIRIAGTAGEGVLSAGDMLNLAMKRAGHHTMLFQSYGAEVRGDGPSMAQVRVSDSPVLSHGDEVDILIALNQDAVSLNLSEIKKGGLVIYDGQPLDTFGSQKTFTPSLPEGIQGISVPLASISYQKLNSLVSKNLVALGAFSAVSGLPFEIIADIVKARFGEKSLSALKMGLDNVTAKASVTGFNLEMRSSLQEMLILSGNQALSMGAIAAGVKVFAGYPITPATDIMEFLATELPKVGGRVIQTEDEISAVCTVLGSSFAGSKAMTATSGPGLSLMVEGIGLASMAEVPVVIVDVQRAGPSTGMPTKTEQSDLNIAIFGSHGDSPRIVLAPSTVEECFYLTIEAFNIAEACQTPVLILSDQFLGQRRETVSPFDLSGLKLAQRLKPDIEELKGYKRYRLTDNGVSPLAVPGMEGGEHAATGLEHREDGSPSYDPDNHIAMTAKRWGKLELAKLESVKPVRFGAADALIGIIGWGSTEGAVREAVSKANEVGLKVAALYPKLLNPLQTDIIEDFVRPLKKVVVVENNYTGQFAAVLRSNGITCESFTLCEGRPFKVAEVLKRIEESCYKT